MTVLLRKVRLSPVGEDGRFSVFLMGSRATQDYVPQGDGLTMDFAGTPFRANSFWDFEFLWESALPPVSTYGMPPPGLTFNTCEAEFEIMDPDPLRSETKHVMFVVTAGQPTNLGPACQPHDNPAFFYPIVDEPHPPPMTRPEPKLI